MLLQSSNIIGQNRLILPPAGCVSAAMNRQRPPAMVKTAADDHLADLVRLAAAAAPPLPEGGDGDEHGEADAGIDRNQPAAREGEAQDVRLNCWSPQTR